MVSFVVFVNNLVDIRFNTDVFVEREINRGEIRRTEAGESRVVRVHHFVVIVFSLVLFLRDFLEVGSLISWIVDAICILSCSCRVIVFVIVSLIHFFFLRELNKRGETG